MPATAMRARACPEIESIRARAARGAARLARARPLLRAVLFAKTERGPMQSPTRVELCATHPGFADPIYRGRRDEIAAIADAYRFGDAIPDVAYTDEEHGVWNSVWQHLRPMHRAHVARELRAVLDAFALPGDRIPQLREVSAELSRRTGFA